MNGFYPKHSREDDVQVLGMFISGADRLAQAEAQLARRLAEEKSADKSVKDWSVFGGAWHGLTLFDPIWAEMQSCS